MVKLSPPQVQQLREFVKVLKSHPDVLHESDLGFFRDYLTSLGAKIPEKEVEEERFEEEAEEEPEVEEPEEEIEEPVDPDVIPAETDAPQPMGDLEAEVSEESLDKAGELRGQASELIAQGEIQQAVDILTEAITKHNGAAAPLYATRAQCFLRLKKPASAIRDADIAIKINPDSASAFRVRGKAKALLGQYREAASDLKGANQRDYDPEVNELLKSITKKADEVAERQKKRDAAKQRREKKHKSASGAGKPSGPGAGAGAGWLPQDLLGKLMQDPAFLQAMQDPEVLPILTEVMKDPSAALKYKDHPKVSKLFEKFGSFIPKQ